MIGSLRTSNQSLRFILSLKLNSGFITSKPVLDPVPFGDRSVRRSVWCKAFGSILSCVNFNHSQFTVGVVLEWLSVGLSFWFCLFVILFGLDLLEIVFKGLFEVSLVCGSFGFWFGFCLD